MPKVVESFVIMPEISDLSMQLTGLSTIMAFSDSALSSISSLILMVLLGKVRFWPSTSFLKHNFSYTRPY